MGEHHKPLKANATVRFNTWLLASRVSESLSDALTKADEWSQWIVEAKGDGHKEARRQVLMRIVAEKQANPGYNAEVLEMAKKVEEWLGAQSFEQLANSPQLYRAG